MGGDEDTDEVIVAQQLVHFLIRCLLEHIEFDERQYQKCNPDVADTIRQKKVQSGREHFVSRGKF